MLVCNHCGNCEPKAFDIKYKGANIGLYCRECGKWVKWVGKDELRALEGVGLKIDNPHNANTCAYCGSSEFEKRQGSVHIGLYCKKCGKWHKWIKKK